MAKILPFPAGAHSKRGKKELHDLSDLLQNAVALRKQSFGTEENGVFQLSGGIKDLFSARMNTLLLEQKNINAGMFRCALYVGDLFGGAFLKVPDSYYSIDYLLQAEEENDPAPLKAGADMCCMVSILFPERSSWRAMRAGDFNRRGMQLYLAFYGATKRAMAWHMAKNYEPIVVLAKKCVKDLERRNN